MAGHPYVVCDVFTDRPLQGNQLAVFTDGPAIHDALLQSLAREMNFSETVFVYPANSDADARIRIFTPVTELPFAGHPILGAAFVLATQRRLADVRLKTRSGVIPIRFQREGDRITFGWMRQPIPKIEPYGNAAPLFVALRVDRSRLPVEVYDNGVKHLFVVLDSGQAVARLKPDMTALSSVAPDVGVNCLAGKGSVWKTRMFGPGLGVAEDPGTGSAAGPLAVHLARHGLIPFGAQIRISQGEELRRPSTLFARAEGTSDRIERVEVGGSAVIVARGEFSL